MNIRLRYGLVILIFVLVSIFIAPSHIFPSNSKSCPVKGGEHISVSPHTICLGRCDVYMTRAALCLQQSFSKQP